MGASNSIARELRSTALHACCTEMKRWKAVISQIVIARMLGLPDVTMNYSSLALGHIFL